MNCCFVCTCILVYIHLYCVVCALFYYFYYLLSVPIFSCFRTNAVFFLSIFRTDTFLFIKIQNYFHFFLQQIKRTIKKWTTSNGFIFVSVSIELFLSWFSISAKRNLFSFHFIFFATSHSPPSRLRKIQSREKYPRFIWHAVQCNG